MPQAAPVIAAIQEEASKIPRIYVASIHIDLSSEDVKRFAYTCSCTYMHMLTATNPCIESAVLFGMYTGSVFEAFGKIAKIDLAPGNVPGKHRGWGYIDYASHKSAQDAIASMNLFDLGGQFLRIRGVRCAATCM